MVSQVLNKGMIEGNGGRCCYRRDLRLWNHLAETFAFVIKQIENPLRVLGYFREAGKNALCDDGEACRVPHVPRELRESLQRSGA